MSLTTSSFSDVGCNHLSFPQHDQTGDTVNLFQGCGRDAGGEIVAIVRMVKPFENFAAIFRIPAGDIVAARDAPVRCDNAVEQLAVEAADISLVAYEDERQLDDIMSLVDRDLSEPYSIFTYRYFLHNWPKLCFVAKAGEATVGAIVCKAERELEDDPYTGYIAMLAVDTSYRKHGVGTALASKAIEAMRHLGCDEVVLETEVTNSGALKLYTKLGFSKSERLIKYYLNGVDAFRLKLWFR